MFIDLLRKNALIGRVWLESVWVGLFWIMNLGVYISSSNTSSVSD